MAIIRPLPRMLASIGFAITLLAPIARAQTEGGAPPRPHLVVVLSDDQRFDSLSCLGNPYIETPHLDALAAEGVTFPKATRTCPLCQPSRAAVLTGRFPHRLRVDGNRTHTKEILEQTLATDLLRAEGYRTAFIGKWHFEDEQLARDRFDQFVSFEGHGSYEGQVLEVGGEAIESDEHLTDELTHLAVDWIGAQDPRPFALFLSLKACHPPFRPAERHQGAVEERGVELPLTADQNLPEAMRLLGLRELAPDWRRLDDYERFLELVLSVDDCVGALGAALREREVEQDTVFLFTSDNGFMHGEHGLLGKARTYDGSLLVPMILRYPAGLPAGTRVEAPVLAVDLAPTLLELAGVKAAFPCDGQSVVALARGEAAAGRTATLHYSPMIFATLTNPKEYALQHDGWKLMVFRRGRQHEAALFHLSEDPREEINRIADPAVQELLPGLRRTFFDVASAYGLPADWVEELHRSGFRTEGE